jgi:hypothetical protein
MYPRTTFVLSIPHTKKSHLEKCLSVCLSHPPQAHPHEFLDGQDLGFKTAQNFMFVKIVCLD